LISSSPRTHPEIIKNGYRSLNVKDERTNRLELERLRTQLMVERSTFFSHWQQIDEFISTRRTRFYVTDVDRGNRRNGMIINSTGTHAWHTLRSGMMSGFTSPSRPWFRLTTQDPDLAKMEPVKEWLYDATWLMHDTFLRSNVYNSLPTVYGDMGGFGTSAMMVMEDFERVIHTQVFVLGSYYIFNDYKLHVNGFMRDFRMSVRQIVEQFAWNEQEKKFEWDNVSTLVQQLWHNGTTEAWIDISHAIIPNPDWNPRSLRSDDKKYISVYYERGAVGSQYTISTVDSTKTLQRKGFDRFRILAPRWEVSGEDIYGTMCPGMESLGDIQGLQMYERRSAQALEKSINPAMVGPSSLRNAKATTVPGDITYLDTREGQQKFEPAYMLQPNFQQLNIMIQAHEARIKKAFHEDLWLVVSNLDKGNVTAEEIRALQNEKLQEIGPVVDRLNQDLLDPLVEITFEIMMQQGRLPPPPPMMRKQPMKVEYTSIIAQAQKALAAGGIEQFTGYIMKLQEMKPNDPSVIDKFNPDEAIDHYGDSLTIPPGIVRDDDEVKKIRAGRQQQQQKAQQAAMAEQASNTAKNLAQAPTDGGNALSDLMAHANAGSLGPGQ
jgi:hypothetical protein